MRFQDDSGLRQDRVGKDIMLTESWKTAKDWPSFLEEIQTLAAHHTGPEAVAAGNRERLKGLGVFFQKRTPDQFTIRIRITNGQTTSVQLRTIATLARRLGNGILDLTTRQQIELRAVTTLGLPAALEALRAVDLCSLQTGANNIRNVTTCPLAGLTDLELFDASPVGAEFTDVFLGNPDFNNLPRKFNATITGCLEHCTNSESQDLALIPAVKEVDGTPGFNVAVGGKMGSGGTTLAQPLDVFVAPHLAARLAAEMVLLFRDERHHDPRTKARLAFLLQEWGIDRFRRQLEKRWGRTLDRAQRDVRLSTKTDHLGIRPQKQEGLISVGLCVPAGRVTGEQLDELARLADAYGTGHVRLTTRQDAILVNVPEARIPQLLAEPLLTEFSPESQPFLRGLVACTGTDYCDFALIETKEIGRRLADALGRRFVNVPPVSIHWSGCGAGCGNHGTADIGCRGAKARVNDQVVDAVSIFVGGKAGREPRAAEKIMELVPVSLLEEVLPLVLSNLELLRHVRRDHEAEERVLMVPVAAEP